MLISKQGEVKVVDFGLAKATSQIEITDPGVVKGKMSYLSPEAARGEEVDHRADIFAVGILLYEMLTGKRLFYGETDYQTVELVRNAKIPPLRPQNPQVEPELEDIVRKALAKRKEDRFQSATDLQDALAQYSYSRGLKVISRDIAELVRQCLDDKRMQSGEGKKPGSIIDTSCRTRSSSSPRSTSRTRARSRFTPTTSAPRPEPPPVASRRRLRRSARLGRRAAGAGTGRRRAAGARSAPDLARRTGQRRPGAARAAAERMRVPTGENRAPQNSPPVGFAGRVDAGPRGAGQRPRADARTPGAAPRPPRRRRRHASVQAPSHAGRSFLIGALIGIVLLGAAAAVFVSKHGGLGGAPHATQPAVLARASSSGAACGRAWRDRRGRARRSRAARRR